MYVLYELQISTYSTNTDIIDRWIIYTNQTYILILVHHRLYHGKYLYTYFRDRLSFVIQFCKYMMITNNYVGYT